MAFSFICNINLVYNSLMWPVKWTIIFITLQFWNHSIYFYLILLNFNHVIVRQFEPIPKLYLNCSRTNFFIFDLLKNLLVQDLTHLPNLCNHAYETSHPNLSKLVHPNSLDRKLLKLVNKRTLIISFLL